MDFVQEEQRVVEEKLEEEEEEDWLVVEGVRKRKGRFDCLHVEEEGRSDGRE